MGSGEEKEEKKKITRSRETRKEKGVKPEIKRREETGVKLIKTHEEEGMGTKTVRKNTLQRLKQQTANRNLQSCGSRKHRRFDRGGERDGMWLLPVVNPNFNTHTHTLLLQHDSLQHLRNTASR